MYSDPSVSSSTSISCSISLLSSISLLVDIKDIRVFGDTIAEVDLNVGMAGGDDSILGFSADAKKFELELEKVDDEWLLIGARWAELGSEL